MVCGQGAADEVFDAVADEVAVGSDGMSGVPRCAEDRVHRVAEVVEGVEQGAVEVEDYRGAGQLTSLK